jgi:hypothetical protein
MVRLRGHHLICLHFFNGEGYDSAFIENLANVLKRAESEDIMVCGETDDICESCPYCKEFKCEYGEGADEDIKEMDTMALDLLETENWSIVRWEGVKGKIPEIFPRWYKNQCPECDWKRVCEKNKFYKKLISTYNSW